MQHTKYAITHIKESKSVSIKANTVIGQVTFNVVTVFKSHILMQIIKRKIRAQINNGYEKIISTEQSEWCMTISYDSSQI